MGASAAATHAIVRLAVSDNPEHRRFRVAGARYQPVESKLTWPVQVTHHVAARCCFVRRRSGVSDGHFLVTAEPLGACRHAKNGLSSCWLVALPLGKWPRLGRSRYARTIESGIDGLDPIPSPRYGPGSVSVALPVLMSHVEPLWVPAQKA